MHNPLFPVVTRSLAGRRLKAFQSCIAHRAEVLWRLRGEPEGRDVAIWLEAERRMFARLGVDRRSIRTRLRDGYAAPVRHRSATSY